MKIPTEKIEAFRATDKDVAGAITHVWLDVIGERMLATDGHMAMRVSVGIDVGDEAGLVPSEAFELARKELQIISKRQGGNCIPDPWLKISCGEDIIYIENILTNTKHLVTRPKLNSGEKFPVVDAVFPEASAPASVNLSLDLLARVVKNIDPLGANLSFFIQGSEKAVLLATTSGKGSVVLIPMKGAVEQDEVNSRALPMSGPVVVSEQVAVQ